MLVTLTGAYRNAGDYLIGHRARALLSHHLDDEIINLDRKSLTDESYELFNKARAIILCGGPAYQKEMFPKVYNLDLNRIQSKIVPMGLGWKGNLKTTPQDFEFSEPSLQFIKKVHSNITTSGVRDVVTLEVIKNQRIDNVMMTGCPAWYDLANIDRDYEFQSTANKIVLSLPAKPQPDTFDIIRRISAEFPQSEKVLALHHGWRPSKTAKGNEMLRWHLNLLAFATPRGWKMQNLADGLTKFEELYSSADLHVGYRVHAHIYSLSQQSPSILINEDSRGVGQVKTLGGENVMAGTGAAPLMDAIHRHFDSQGAQVLQATQTIKATYPVMTQFLESI
jgi:hypothetical protein